jgi:hypothetical protein
MIDIPEAVKGIREIRVNPEGSIPLSPRIPNPPEHRKKVSHPDMRNRVVSILFLSELLLTPNFGTVLSPLSHAPKCR